MLMLCSLKWRGKGVDLFCDRRFCFASLGFCSRKLLEVKLPDVLSQSRGRGKEKRKIQLLSAFCSFEGRRFIL